MVDISEVMPRLRQEWADRNDEPFDEKATWGHRRAWWVLDCRGKLYSTVVSNREKNNP